MEHVGWMLPNSDLEDRVDVYWNVEICRKEMDLDFCESDVSLEWYVKFVMPVVHMEG